MDKYVQFSRQNGPFPNEHFSKAALRLLESKRAFSNQTLTFRQDKLQTQQGGF